MPKGAAYPAVLFGLLCLLPASLWEAQAAPLTTDPMLRIEAGRHTGTVMGAAGDANCRLLVTGGNDKTVRIWGLKPGYQARLLRIIRPPIGPGTDGRILTTALSPDTSMVAVGGVTQKNNHWIQLFETRSGRLLGRLGPFQQPVNRLAFSHDGRRLAAVTRAEGLHVWRTDDWTLLLSDRNYGQARSYGVAFDIQGRLFTTSFDGYLRLYGPGLRLLRKVRARRGGQPFTVAAHPSGGLIAVGHANTVSVDIYRASDLKFLYSADTGGLQNANLTSVAWSPDGQRLFAGGELEDNKNVIIRFWDQAGRGRGQNRITSTNSIFGIVPCHQGVSVAAGDPAIVQFDRNMVRYSYEPSFAANMRDKLFSAFTMSTDARRVRFGLGRGGKNPWLFDLNRLSFQESPISPADLYRATVEDGTLRIRNWKYTDRPTLNGRPIAIPKLEISRALAIKPDRSGFLLASSRVLHHFDRAGNRLWQHRARDYIQAVLVSSDNRVAVTANNDGTVRWHRMSDGKELLALFVHAGDKRWVIWTPKGYYAASPGGEELIGWHVNRGWNLAADFFPASQFRKQFYRPDIVSLMLSTLDEDKAIAQANRLANRKRDEDRVRNVLPPVLEIVSPGNGSEFSQSTITISYKLRSPSGLKIKKIQPLIDGRPLNTRGLGQVTTSTGDAHSITLPVPARNVEISLIAHTVSTSSVPVRLKLRWAGAGRGPASAKGAGMRAEDIKKPKLYALLIGVSRYDREHLRLGYAAKDAKDMAKALKAQQGGVYREVVVKLLTDEQATATNIRDALDWLEGEVTSRDVGLLFMAGHGITDPKQRFYFIPKDGNPEKLRSSAIAQADIQDIIGSLAGKALMFIDACHSGKSIERRRLRGGADITAIVNELASAENGVVMFASSTGREVSEENDSWQNGAFTKALLEGLKGRADYSKDGVISITELDLWLSERVKILTEKRQHPVMRRPETIPDFPIALAR